MPILQKASYNPRALFQISGREIIKIIRAKATTTKLVNTGIFVEK